MTNIPLGFPDGGLGMLTGEGASASSGDIGKASRGEMGVWR